MRSRPVTRTLAGFDKWRGGFDLIRQSGRAIARALTNTFSGIRPIDLPAFVVAEFACALVALALMNWLLRATSDAAPLHPEAQL